MDLNTLWFILLGVLLAGYAILDGFDLGVGILQPVAKTDEERRILLNSIGPIWDGNEVWLVTFGGAMFAAFGESYATVFSGFYIVFMLILFALIVRAISIEFRSKIDSRAWRHFWDYGFFASSLLASLLFGTAVGAAMNGVPLDGRGVFVGHFVDQLTPYTLSVGVMTVAMFTMHGAIYLYLKTEGELQQRLTGWMWRGFGFFLISYLLVTIMTLVLVPRATKVFDRSPLGVAGGDSQRAGDREYSPSDYATPPRLRVYFVERHDRRPRLPVRRGAVSESRHIAADREQPHDLQRGIVPYDARHHDNHCGDRHAVRRGVHVHRLLELPRQGEAARAQLLRAGQCVHN